MPSGIFQPSNRRSSMSIRSMIKIIRVMLYATANRFQKMIADIQLLPQGFIFYTSESFILPT